MMNVAWQELAQALAELAEYLKDTPAGPWMKVAAALVALLTPLSFVLAQRHRRALRREVRALLAPYGERVAALEEAFEQRDMAEGRQSTLAQVRLRMRAERTRRRGVIG